MMATRTGSDGVTSTAMAESNGSSGLSTGAKAGIGSGIAVGALVVLGALLWFCVAKRRNAARASGQGSQPRNSAPAMSQGSTSAAGGKKRQNSDYFGPTAGVGPFTEFEQVDSSGQHGQPSPGYERGVPVKPHSPGDIAVPVEIDSRTSNLPVSGNVGEYKPQNSQNSHELP
jgi:hypothetical protein